MMEINLKISMVIIAYTCVIVSHVAVGLPRHRRSMKGDIFIASALIITATMILSQTPVDSLNKSIKSLFGQQ
jgi:hypothetical protein